MIHRSLTQEDWTPLRSNTELVAVSVLPDLLGVVVGARDEAPIHREGHAPNPVLVPLQRRQASGAIGTPDLRGLVSGASGDAPVRRDGHACDRVPAGALSKGARVSTSSPPPPPLSGTAGRDTISSQKDLGHQQRRCQQPG